MAKSINVYLFCKSVILSNLRYYLIWSFLIMAIMGIYVFSLPRTYESSTKVIPETTSENGISLPKSLSGLSSLAGISLGNTGGKDAINPDIYPDIFNSTTFIVDVLKLKVKNVKGETMTFHQYLVSASPQPWWETQFNKGKSENQELLKPISPTHFTKDQEILIKTVQNSIVCNIDKQTGMIDLKTRTTDPVVSASLADAIMERLQQYIIEYRTSKAKVDLNYLELIYKEAQQEYTKKQHAYAAYADSHTDLTLASYQTKLEDLENEMQNTYNKVTQLGQQVSTATARLQERTPAFTVIQQAAVPVRPSGPKRMLTMIFSFMGTSMLCFLYFSYKALKML